jgi:hypothetical protein
MEIEKINHLAEKLSWLLEYKHYHNKALEDSVDLSKLPDCERRKGTEKLIFDYLKRYL